MTGLGLLIVTLECVWPNPGLVNLIPASLLIGFGQALIVNCFYRAGLADVPHKHAGTGSAMLATMQQVSLGLGPAVLGAVFAETLQHSHLYLAAGVNAIMLELGLMLVLLAAAVHRFLRQRGRDISAQNEAMIVVPE
jgi:hypothetical protein